MQDMDIFKKTRYTLDLTTNSRDRLNKLREVLKKYPQFGTVLMEAKQRIINVGDNIYYRDYLHLDSDRLHLRERGFCDEISNRIRHRGWFSDSMQDGVIRGIVYRLPSKKGKKRYLAGYYESILQDITLDITHVYSDAVDAAHASNKMAETAAENMRQYEAKYTAEQQKEGLKETISDTRKETIAIIRQLKAAKKTPDITNLDLLCQTIRAVIKNNINKIADCKSRISALDKNYWLAVD